MGQLHAVGALVVFVTVAVAALAAAVAGLRGGAGWLDRLQQVVMVVIGLQIAMGVLAYLAGDRPAEPLHFLYAVVALGALPVAASFAAEAPPRPRAWVLAVAMGVVLLLLWRLASTG